VTCLLPIGLRALDGAVSRPDSQTQMSVWVPIRVPTPTIPLVAGSVMAPGDAGAAPRASIPRRRLNQPQTPAPPSPARPGIAGHVRCRHPRRESNPGQSGPRLTRQCQSCPRQRWCVVHISISVQIQCPDPRSNPSLRPPGPPVRRCPPPPRPAASTARPARHPFPARSAGPPSGPAQSVRSPGRSCLAVAELQAGVPVTEGTLT
jgi:hypothetical protein